MNVAALITRLSELPPFAEVMILDGENGGGTPRTLNVTPHLREVTDADAFEASDCEDLVGKRVVVLGYGCY
jgi:hypothetical protein